MYPADRQDHRARNGRRHLDLLSSLESLSNFGAGPGTVWHPLTFLWQSDRFLKDCDHNFQKSVPHVPEGLKNVWQLHTNQLKQAQMRAVKNEEVYYLQRIYGIVFYTGFRNNNHCFAEQDPQASLHAAAPPAGSAHPRRPLVA